MSEENRNPVGMIALAIVLVVSILFAPLAASVVESYFFRTQHVEGFFRKIGLHDEIGRFYQLFWPIAKVLSGR